jgi:hypothetical protein
MYRWAATVAAAFAAAGLSVEPQAHKSPHETATSPAAQVVITGCVQAETDYRQAHEKGPGGPFGTGLGSGNEFVLINASAPRGVEDVWAGSNSVGGTMAFELGGHGEAELAKFVNQRVEITGTLKAQEIGPSGPTGGPTAKLELEGDDLVFNLGRDLKLRELEVIRIRLATGSCN